MSDDANLLYTQKGPSLKSQINDFFRNFSYHSREYVKSLFPIRIWIGRYNLTWLYRDFIAGLTVGSVIIPQAMGFANIIGIPVQYGLYSSFVGMLVYTFVATTKDMTIGPTAVMSITLSQAIPRIRENYGGDLPYSDTDIVTSVCFFSGIISLIIGFLRLGWIFNFIPVPVITGYITASVVTISIGQLPNLFGIIGIETRKNAPYKILIDFFAGLGRTKVDAAIGLTSLAFLYGVKHGCSYLEKRYPRYKRFFFFTSILRYIVCIVITTFISWLVLRGQNEKNFSFKVVKSVPRGLNHVKVPPLGSDILPAIFSVLHVVILISLLEHISIAKSFARVNDYKINPSQEIIAVGITNIIGCFLGAITATGSFSRSALKSRTDVRTPLAGIFSGCIVLLALYVLTPLFYYIPQAALSAVIIQAVLVLLSRPSYIKLLYEVELFDLAVFAVAIIVSLFTNLELGIAASMGLALGVLLVRIARPRIDALGRFALTSKSDKSDEFIPKYAYVPLDNPSFTTTKTPPEGILIFRFTEALTFPNSTYIDDELVEYIELNTRRMYRRPEKKGDQPWNEGDDKFDSAKNEALPQLRAVIYDFSAVSMIDSSGFQALLDIKRSVNKHAARDVEYHFVNILDERVQSALIKAGFGQLISATKDKEKGVETIEEGIDYDVSVTSKKRFFHLTIDEAIAAAQS